VGFFACRASLTLTPTAHADRVPLVATAHASHASPAVFLGFLQLPDRLKRAGTERGATGRTRKVRMKPPPGWPKRAPGRNDCRPD
jgi:hypothetical protein